MPNPTEDSTKTDGPATLRCIDGFGNWTFNCPKTEGYYWCSRWDDITIPFIVWVRGGLRGENVHVFTLGWHRHTDAKFSGALWAGPITAPAFPNIQTQTGGATPPPKGTQ